MNSHPVAIAVAALAVNLAIPLVAAPEKPPADIIVNFGDANTLAGVANQVVVPDEAVVRKRGTVTFVVNGNGHGIAIYPVSKDTTRENITAQLCARNPTTGVCADAGFANGDHEIRDGKGNLIIQSGTNPPNQRIDDAVDRLFATSTQIEDVAGQFLLGSSATAAGTQLQFRFDKSGRYLVICMNRGHLLNNWMFGFVNVVE